MTPLLEDAWKTVADKFPNHTPSQISGPFRNAIDRFFKEAAKRQNDIDFDIICGAAHRRVLDEFITAKEAASGIPN